MGIMVSTIYGAIKFHTTEGIGTVFSTHESDKVKEGMKKVRETPQQMKKGFSAALRLRDLLRANADVFAWTHADMIGIPRTITVKGKPFNTEHKFKWQKEMKIRRPSSYLIASTESISAALFAKREEEQVPIYFLSKVLNGAELNYPGLKKLILALVHAARRLQRYF
ncbi:reverse transcriptase domain-containing protein [Tanacetum coccineum]